MSEWKEYITADTLTLAVAIATLIVAVIALVFTKRALDVSKRSLKFTQESERQRILNEIATKDAQLKSTEELMRFMATDEAMYRSKMLKAEIEQLKQQLK
jgi:C4-dicarboxylate transporter